ncbi:MAG: ABC transporter substrate-binding protein [Parvularculales bacterium]
MIVGVAIALCVLATHPAHVLASDDAVAEAFAGETAEAVIALLKNSNPEQRKQEFLKIFVSKVDIRRVARFALGQYARTPTEDQLKEYINILKEFITKVYVSRLSDYSDAMVKITDSTNKGSRGKEVIVKSHITMAGKDQSVNLNWWLLREDGGYKIFDLQVAGIWLAQEQRATFVSILKKGDGKFPVLLSHLRKQIENASKT